MNGKHNYISARELFYKYKRFKKKDLIRDIENLSCILNCNTAGITGDYKTTLEELSKRKLIRTLILLQHANTIRIKKNEMGGMLNATAK